MITVISIPNILSKYVLGFSQIVQKKNEVVNKILSSKAIKEEQIPWISLVDYKAFKSEAARAYGIMGIPASFLIDKNGNIRSRYDEFGNPIFVYRALDEQDLKHQIQELKEDIKILLDE